MDEETPAAIDLQVTAETNNDYQARSSEGRTTDNQHHHHLQ